MYAYTYAYIHTYTHTEMIDCRESDSMLEIYGKFR